jgi:hypothetical protein
MKHYGRAFLAIVVVLMGTYPSISLVMGTDLTTEDYKEYILNFIGAASYQLPEPASTLSSLMFAAPEGTKGLLKAWAYQKWLSAERNYQNAADSDSTSQMNYYSDQSNRWQAVLTCLAGDCSSMQKLEKEGTGGYPQTIRECENGGSEICGTWTRQGNQYVANWDNGATATVNIVSWDDLWVVLKRYDSGGSSAGLTARYFGQLNGNKIEGGTVTWTLNGNKWSGTWSANW